MTGNLVLVRTERQYTLASTFLRFQEHYENPKFRGEIFSLEEFMDWYASRYGNFTYCEDWDGFNIPSSVLKPFREGKFNPLSRKEQLLLDLLANVPEPFYTVGIYGDKVDLPTLKHELVHGLFGTVPSYRDSVLKIVSRDRIKSLTSVLQTLGYHSSVWTDEANAYLLSGLTGLYSDGLNPTPTLHTLQKQLRSLFKESFGFSLRKASEAQILKLFHSIQL